MPFVTFVAPAACKFGSDCVTRARNRERQAFSGLVLKFQMKSGVGCIHGGYSSFSYQWTVSGKAAWVGFQTLVRRRCTCSARPRSGGCINYECARFVLPMRAFAATEVALGRKTGKPKLLLWSRETYSVAFDGEVPPKHMVASRQAMKIPEGQEHMAISSTPGHALGLWQTANTLWL